jgi:hypothetical protein
MKLVRRCTWESLLSRFIQNIVIVCLLVACLTLLPSNANANSLRVNCGTKDALSTINGALKMLDPTRPNTLIVSGACKENLAIQGFDRLTLTAKPGASISDASGGSSIVVFITDSTRMTLEGFEVNGGRSGIFCVAFSTCRFKNNTIQGVTGFGGVSVINSKASFEGDVIQDNSGDGVLAQSSTLSLDNVTVQRNLNAGVDLMGASTLTVRNSNVNNNGGAADASGIRIAAHSTAELTNNSITANHADGVRIFQASAAQFGGGNVITGNGAPGAGIEDLSFADFAPGNVITGNASPFDVACLPQFSATRGALTNVGGGSTNCTEP